MIKRLLMLLPMAAIVVSTMAQQSPKWLRYPSISPDGKTIAFTYKGDIYTVPVAGGAASALTTHIAHDFMPVWSHDGKRIAFASNRYGNFDIFVVDAAGGKPSRLTFHSAKELPYSFTNDDKAIIFGAVRQDVAGSRSFPTGSLPELYSVLVGGGRVEQVLSTPAEAVTFSGNGAYMLYQDKKGGENEWRKHHTSSVARDIWMYEPATGKHTQLTNFKGEDRNPVLSANDEEMYYLSEESGSFNVYKASLKNPSQRAAITSFKEYPVRFLSISREQTLCFGYDGEIYTLKQGGTPIKVNITIAEDDRSNSEQQVSIGSNVKEMSVSPDGKEVAFIARGDVFVTAVEGGFTKRITATPEQEAFVAFSPDGKSIVYAGERGGRWQIFKASKVRKEEPFFFASTLIKEEPLISNDNDNYQPQISPDGKKVAYIENRTTLKVMNLNTKESVTLLTPNELYYMQDGRNNFSWSPDSQWLLAEYSPTMANGEVILIPADGKKPFVNLTQSGYEDFNAKWISKSQILWFSTRDGLRSAANSGSRQADVYSLFLTRDAWDKFKLSKDDYDLQKSIEEREKKAKEEAKKKEEAGSKDKKRSNDKKSKGPEAAKADSSLKIDWENLTERYAKLTLNSASIGDAVLSKDGETLYYLARFEKGYNLWSVKLRTKEAKLEIPMNARSGSFEWDKEMKNLFLLADGQIFKVEVEKAKREPLKIGADVRIDRNAEREAMFNHVMLRTKRGFYSSKYHGVDWNALTAHYRQYLPYIGTGFEFAEMLSEMLGELNSSHSGASYNSRIADADATASLGILTDYTYKNDGVRIAEVIPDGPLDKAKIEVKPGMIIRQVDGDTIKANSDFAAYLNLKAGKFTLLNVFDPTTGKEQQITIKPISLGEESALLYKRWVKRNEAAVEKLSNGELGYVHIPGMGDGPYRDTYSEMMGKYHNRKGVVVDTRYNGGGDLVADLAMFFTGKKFIDYANETRSLGYEPSFRWTKPTVALVSEDNYSDASCFACAYKQLGIGKMVGMPVPGTCSFAGWEMLSDGETSWGMVPVSAKDMNGAWMENLEAVPDYVVKNTPEMVIADHDQQLEKAVEVLLELSKK